MTSPALYWYQDTFAVVSAQTAISGHHAIILELLKGHLFAAKHQTLFTWIITLVYIDGIHTEIPASCSQQFRPLTGAARFGQYCSIACTLAYEPIELSIKTRVISHYVPAG
jgi:hypothetical protein